jgi:hypothetical protein
LFSNEIAAIKLEVCAGREEPCPLRGARAAACIDRDYWLEPKNGVLSLHFTRAVRQADPGEYQGFAYVVQDPAFYIAFLPAKTDPVKLGEGAPKSCKVEIGNPKHDGENDVDRLARAFAQLATPVSATRAVFIQCAA